MSERGREIMKCSLEHLGLSPTEISIYQSALVLGPRPASVFAKSAGLQRTRAYDVLHSLENRGLVERIQKNRIRYFAPRSPEKVLTLLDKQRNLMEEQMRSFRSALPDLVENLTEHSVDCDVRKFRGNREVKEALIELIEENGQTIYSIGDIDLALSQSPGLAAWGKIFTNMRVRSDVKLHLACYGSPSIITDEKLLRKTIFNPSIPSETLAIFGANQLLCLSLGNNASGASIGSKFIVTLLKSIHQAWLSTTEQTLQMAGKEKE